MVHDETSGEDLVKWDYKCDGCAACCVHFAVPVRQPDMDRSIRVRELVKSLELLPTESTYGEAFFINAGEPCQLLSECGSCTVYEERPDVCSRFNPGSSMCQWARGRSGLPMLSAVEKS